MRARSFLLVALACFGVWARAQGDPDVVAFLGARVEVVPVREDLVIARAVRNLLEAS